MPVLTSENIVDVAFHLLRAAGAPDDNASVVADHLANANLAGHDSHGFIRIAQYVRDIREGVVDPVARPQVTGERGGVAQVDGKGAFGQVVAAMSTRLAMDKARANGIGLVTMTNLGHTGRMGTYPEMAAAEGMAATMVTGFVGGSATMVPSALNVAPFGGTEKKLGTNPISMGFPYLPDAPILLDFATSIAAEGKLRVYQARGKPLPGEWVLDKNAVPSRDPNAYYEGGSILPLGGIDGGHKGYALSFMVVLLGALMGGFGSPADVSGVRERLVHHSRRPE